MTHGISPDYLELLLKFPPRVIDSEAAYERALEEMGDLLAKQELSSAEKEFLSLQTALIQAWEEQNYPKDAFELRGIPLLKGLMELHGLRQADLLGIFKSRSIVSTILSGKRRLTVDHIDQLARYFNLPHELFFESSDEKVFA